VLGLLGSYLGIYFYLRVIQFMFMGGPETAGRASRSLAMGASVICLVPSVLLIVFPGWVIGHIG
jgi:NADH-quinone oxidoreductase subunit N